MPATFWARTDSNSANNPALNLTGASAIEITFVPSGTNGDILLEYSGGGVDSDTQILIDGVAYDFVFELSATLPTLNSDGAQQVPDQFEGSVIYVITVQDYPTTGETTRLSFMPEETATAAEMDDFGNGAVDLQNIDTTTPGVVCFARGTQLATPDGERAVEILKVGDHLITTDYGPLPIVWISSSSHVWPGGAEQKLPILVTANALGEGKPHRDLVVSPHHKILLSNPEHELDTGSPGVLVPAKGLTSLSGIRQMKGKRRITYYHVMLERHAILLSEGLPTESFYPGSTAMKMLSPEQRLAVLSAFPNLGDNGSGYGPTVRPCLSYAETKSFALNNKSQLAAHSRVKGLSA